MNKKTNEQKMSNPRGQEWQEIQCIPISPQCISTDDLVMSKSLQDNVVQVLNPSIPLLPPLSRSLSPPRTQAQTLPRRNPTLAFESLVGSLKRRKPVATQREQQDEKEDFLSLPSPARRAFFQSQLQDWEQGLSEPTKQLFSDVCISELDFAELLRRYDDPHVLEE